MHTVQTGETRSGGSNDWNFVKNCVGRIIGTSEGDNVLTLRSMTGSWSVDGMKLDAVLSDSPTWGRVRQLRLAVEPLTLARHRYPP